MDSNKLSAVIEKKIRLLCLDDFPCGDWVAVIDSGLLQFSKLEELVLSVNNIPEIPVENLPSTLKILDVRANRLSSLNSLTTTPPPRLQYLGLGSNALGSREDVTHLTGRHWPQLVCLDLSDCEFQDQQTLLEALCTLPSLKTLVLEGNPFTLASSYPGFTVDSLPQLSCLDASWISPEERYGFRGLAEQRGLIVDQASVKVSVGRMRGIPDPVTRLDKNSPDFPVVTYSFFVTYEFLSNQTPVGLVTYPTYTILKVEPKLETPDATHAMEESGSNTDLQSNNTCESHLWNDAHVSRHSTSKLAWSGCMDFNDTQTYVVSYLGGLKKFLRRGVHLTIEEEKLLSWPAAPEEKKGNKGKDSSIKSDSAKDKKKKSAVLELIQDVPVKRTLGTVHIPLQSLLKGSTKVNILCDVGALHKEFEMQAAQKLKKDLGKKIKEDKELKIDRGKGTAQRTVTSSKAKERKTHEMDVLTDKCMSVPVEPPTVEFSVELQKWLPASEAPHLPQHH